jgi:hypothetical protein
MQIKHLFKSKIIGLTEAEPQHFFKLEPQRYAVPAPSTNCCSTLKKDYTGNNLFIYFGSLCSRVGTNVFAFIFLQKFLRNSLFIFAKYS